MSFIFVVLLHFCDLLNNYQISYSSYGWLMAGLTKELVSGLAFLYPTHKFPMFFQWWKKRKQKFPCLRKEWIVLHLSKHRVRKHFPSEKPTLSCYHCKLRKLGSYAKTLFTASRTQEFSRLTYGKRRKFWPIDLSQDNYRIRTEILWALGIFRFSYPAQQETSDMEKYWRFHVW